MKLPLKWLKEYVDFNVANEEFVEKLMWRGFEVAEIVDELPGISNVFVGRINAMSKHPNADKLSVCSIDIGNDEPLTILTAATNVFEGALVPVAVDGATLAGGIVIHPTNMRGIMSYGMLCSGAELGITDADYEGAEIHGILLLKGEHKPGTRIQEAIGLDSVVFDIELTPNRADCQSILGMCREAAAALGQKFIEPTIRSIKAIGNATDYAKISVENTKLCTRYAARVVTDLRIEPSPEWMQKKLKSVGLRPINNIVDITNYVLVEYGHPMHAFDLSCIAEGHIVVRNAREDEKVVTLDNKERAVTPDMLLIADPNKGVGIAGVMGGANSEITSETKVALFESAVFDASNIRSTARKLKRVTDAASRFIKGVEPVNAMLALERAMELVDELNAGKVVGDVIDVCSADVNERVVDIDVGHVNAILNLQLSASEMKNMLSEINISSTAADDKLTVCIPHFRVDIESGIEADWDIAEEIGRIYGYNRIEPTLMKGDTFHGKLSEEVKHEDAVKDIMAAQGCYEMYNFNFIGPSDLDLLLLEKDDEKRLAVKLMNPFGEDQSLMRTTLMPGMLMTIALNLGRKTGQVRFFEVGNVHLDNNADLPEERKLLGIAFTGTNESFYTLKGTIEALLERLGTLEGYEVEASEESCFQPGQTAVIKLNGEVVGVFGTVHPTVTKNYDIQEKVFVAEISVDKLFKHRTGVKAYKNLPRFPKVDRDIAVTVDENVSAAELVKAIANTKADVIIADVTLFDVYRGKGVPSGQKSMALTFSLRRDDRTLNDDDIKTAIGEVLANLETKYNAKLRS